MIDNIIAQLKGLIETYGMQVVYALLILIIGIWVSKGIKKTLAKLMGRSKLDDTLIPFVTNLVYTGLVAFVVIAALDKLGIQSASFITILGAAGLAVGLALQGSLSNFAAGVLLLIFRPFRVGDYIEGGGVAGVVEEILIFTTTLKTPDNKMVIVPNAKMGGDNIINYSAKEIRRVDLVAGIGYNDNIGDAKVVLEKIVSADSRILKDPAHQIAVSELADSSVNFVVRVWVKTADYWDVYFDTTENIKLEFDAAGISIPFPQQDVHLYKHEK